jgi:Peptidase family M28/PDZ domain
MRILNLTAVAFLLVPVWAEAPLQVRPVEGISPDRYLDHVRFLASPELAGRGNGTEGLEEAGDYLAGEFAAMGLEPAGDDGSWFQTFEVTTGTRIGDGNALTLDGTALDPVRFAPMRFSSSAEIHAPLVFVGYGITAPEMHWDDYQGVDVTGRIVVAFRHEPQENIPESPFNGTESTTHASFRNKAVNARQHGAAGILFLMDPNHHSPQEEEIQKTAQGTETGDSGIAAAYVSMDPLLSLFAREGFDLSEAQMEIDTQLVSRSFELPDVEADLVTDVVREHAPVRNVLAAVRGSDPVLRNEWVVAGAHYDHLGTDGEFSLDPAGEGKIHYGADDNASGTSGILELASVASANRDMLERSILFMGFAGEEIGLLGSSYFVNNPTIPIDEIVAMINLDMIGRIQNDHIYVSGTGTSPMFPDLVDEQADGTGLALDFSESGIGGSDHMSFTLKDIPVLFFFSGLHSDYHRPTDTADKINAEGAARVLTLVYRVLDRLAEVPQRPLYTEVDTPRPITGSGGGYGPYFGSVPDFRDDLGGVLFADITPGSPADDAGLRRGDLLVEFADKTIENLYDFTYALQAQAPGDVVTVVVVRDGERITADVTLEER